MTVLDEKTRAMDLLREAIGHGLSREALQALTGKRADMSIDWCAAETNLKSLLRPPGKPTDS